MVMIADKYIPANRNFRVAQAGPSRRTVKATRAEHALPALQVPFGAISGAARIAYGSDGTGSRAVFTAPRWPVLQRGTLYAATCLRREWYSADSHWGKSWERSRADTARTWVDRLG